MDISSRIAELEALRSLGKISQQEFEVLLELAQNQNSSANTQNFVQAEKEPTEISSSETEIQTASFSPKRILIAIGLIVLLVLFFRVTRQGDPIESKQYKELLKQKASLLDTKSDLEGQTGDADDLQAEIDDYTQKVEGWKLRISDVNSLGISG